MGKEMSKLNELLAELCPDGVKNKRIKDVYKRLKGTPITAAKMREIENSNGEIRIFAGGKTVIDAAEVDIPDANITRVPAVLVQSRGVIDAIYYDKPFTFKNEMWAYTADEKVSVKFLYYVLKNNIEYFRTAASEMGSMPQISLSVTEEFIIPVPPLPVQREIVRILDNFTELITMFTTALTEELVTRQKQFAYYRDELFNFRCTKMVLIPEIADIFIGLVTTMTSHYVPVGVPLIFNSCIKENRFIFEKRTYLDEDFANKNSSRRHRVGDVITVHTGDVGTSAIIGKDLDGSLGFATIVSRIKNLQQIKPQYLCHYLNSNTCKRQIATMIKGDRDNLNLKDFKKIKIPIPSLEEQSRIVSILDRFDALCNDLTSGLPAEIAARQKQYEYYRDKLLTFKEKTR